MNRPLAVILAYWDEVIGIEEDAEVMDTVYVEGI